MSVPPAVRTWRLALRYRVMIIAVQALPLALSVSLLWVPWSGNWFVPRPAVAVLAAAASAGLLMLAPRAWKESVTLTSDAVLVRNVFRRYHIWLPEISSVQVRMNSLVITGTSLVPRPTTALVAAAGEEQAGRSRSPGRHRGGMSVRAAALKSGSAHWTGRKVVADTAAEEIAAAAGRAAPAARREIISARTCAVGILLDLPLIILSAWIGATHQPHTLIGSLRELAGTAIRLSVLMTFVPAAQATVDRAVGWLRRQAGTA